MNSSFSMLGALALASIRTMANPSLAVDVERSRRPEGRMFVRLDSEATRCRAQSAALKTMLRKAKQGRC